MKKKLTAVFTLVLCAMMILTGCSTQKADSTDDPLSDGVLNVALEDSYLPMEYRNDSNELVGFDIDLANALAEKLGVECDIQSVAWDGIFTGLNAKKYDVLISTVSITPERQENYAMSEAYLSNGIVIVGRKDYGDDAAKTFEDLAGKSVGVQLETSADIAAQKLEEETGTSIDLKQFDAMLDAFSALKGKQIDYVMADSAVADYYVTQDPDTYVVTSTEPLTNEPIGVMARKDCQDLIDQIDKALDELRADGTLKEISIKWFGQDNTDDIDTTLNVIE